MLINFIRNYSGGCAERHLHNTQIVERFLSHPDEWIRVGRATGYEWTWGTIETYFQMSNYSDFFFFHLPQPVWAWCVKLYLSTLSHMPWNVLYATRRLFWINTDYGRKKRRGGGSWKGTQYNLDYQQPHPLWATAIPWRVKKPVCNGIFLLTHLQQWWYCRMKYGIWMSASSHKSFH